MKRRPVPKDPVPETFKIFEQHVTRLVVTGEPAHLDEALAYITSRGFMMSQVGPKLVGVAKANLKDERRFILLAEKVER